MSDLDFSEIEREAERSTGREVSDNIAEDYVELSRGSVIANEAQFLLTQFQYGTALMYPMERYTNSVLIGPSSGGKTQVQKYAKPCWPSEWRYETSSASGKAFLDDDEWDLALMAPLDEIDKISDDIREQLKSFAGEDEGMTHARSISDDDRESGRRTVKLKAGAKPYQVLFAPEKNKDSIPSELDNRLLKIFVDDNKHIREAIGRKEFGHENITVPGLDHEYVYETRELRQAIREHLRQLPTEVVDYDDDGNPIDRRGSSFGKLPEWVWYVVDPIFDFDTTATNRFFGMVANLMRSSAVQNHHTRMTVSKTYDGREVDAYLVEPQDVANVLCCQRTLLGTTHSLDPQKRAILDAVRNMDGIDNKGGCTLSQIKEYLENGEMSVPDKSVLRKILKEELSEGYYIRVREGEGPHGADIFQWREDGSINPPRLYNLQEVADRHGVDLWESNFGVDVDDPFEDCTDPIRDQPFKQTVEEFRDEVNSSDVSRTIKQSEAGASTDAARFMGGDDTDDSSGDAQQSLTSVADGDESDEDGTDTYVDGPVETAVYERVCETVGADTRVFNVDGEADLEDYHLMGIVEEGTPVEQAELTDTLLDPTHDFWDRDDRDDDWVVKEADARREVSDAFSNLRHRGVIRFTDDTPEGFLGVKVADVDG